MQNQKNKKKRKSNGKAQYKRTNSRKKYFDDYKEGLNSTKYDETNDPSWYAQYPELMRDSASIPYSIPTGTFVKWDIDVDPNDPVYTQGQITQTGYQSVPGIMTIGICPTPGLSLDATSPVNVATKMLYTKVRAENSGARNYDAPDLMLYCLAMDQVYSLLTWYNRIYGTLMLYSQVNRYIPREMLVAQRVDFDDLIMHINDFKAFLDTATAQAAVFSVPNDMKIFNRHAFMYQNIYKDAESPKAQMYQFAPRVFYYYDEYNGAGRLMPIDVVGQFPNGLGFADLITLFHMLMDPIVASEDFNIMSGDILKAFGEGNLLKLQIMPQGYTVIPIADYEVLTQIKNLTMTNRTSTMLLILSNSPAEFAIHQDANVEYIEYNPRFAIHVSQPHNIVRDRYLSTYKSNPEPSDNMVYTRLMYTLRDEGYDDSGTTFYDTYFETVGSEFVTGVDITLFYTDGNGKWTAGNYSVNVLSEASLSLTWATFFRLMLLKHFDFAPAAYIFVPGTGLTQFYPSFDLDNWTIVHSYELSKMHRTAIMSMLRVPMIGSALPSSLRN